MALQDRLLYPGNHRIILTNTSGDTFEAVDSMLNWVGINIQRKDIRSGTRTTSQTFEFIEEGRAFIEADFNLFGMKADMKIRCIQLFGSNEQFDVFDGMLFPNTIKQVGEHLFITGQELVDRKKVIDFKNTKVNLFDTTASVGGGTLGSFEPQCQKLLIERDKTKIENDIIIDFDIESLDDDLSFTQNESATPGITEKQADPVLEQNNTGIISSDQISKLGTFKFSRNQGIAPEQFFDVEIKKQDSIKNEDLQSFPSLSGAGIQGESGGLVLYNAVVTAEYFSGSSSSADGFQDVIEVQILFRIERKDVNTGGDGAPIGKFKFGESISEKAIYYSSVANINFIPMLINQNSVIIGSFPFIGNNIGTFNTPIFIQDDLPSSELNRIISKIGGFQGGSGANKYSFANQASNTYSNSSTPISKEDKIVCVLSTSMFLPVNKSIFNSQIISNANWKFKSIGNDWRLTFNQEANSPLVDIGGLEENIVMPSTGSAIKSYQREVFAPNLKETIVRIFKMVGVQKGVVVQDDTAQRISTTYAFFSKQQLRNEPIRSDLQMNWDDLEQFIKRVFNVVISITEDQSNVLVKLKDFFPFYNERLNFETAVNLGDLTSFEKSTNANAIHSSIEIAYKDQLPTQDLIAQSAPEEEVFGNWSYAIDNGSPSVYNVSLPYFVSREVMSDEIDMINQSRKTGQDVKSLPQDVFIIKLTDELATTTGEKTEISNTAIQTNVEIGTKYNTILFPIDIVRNNRTIFDMSRRNGDIIRFNSTDSSTDTVITGKAPNIEGTTIQSSVLDFPTLYTIEAKLFEREAFNIKSNPDSLFKFSFRGEVFFGFISNISIDIGGGGSQGGKITGTFLAVKTP